FSYSAAPPPTATSTLSLHDALPIYLRAEVHADPREHEADRDRQQAPDDPVQVEPGEVSDDGLHEEAARADRPDDEEVVAQRGDEDRKSTRLNSSHVKSSYAVFCLKK